MPHLVLLWSFSLFYFAYVCVGTSHISIQCSQLWSWLHFFTVSVSVLFCLLVNVTIYWLVVLSSSLFVILQANCDFISLFQRLDFDLSYTVPPRNILPDAIQKGFLLKSGLSFSNRSSIFCAKMWYKKCPYNGHSRIFLLTLSYRSMPLTVVNYLLLATASHLQFLQCQCLQKLKKKRLLISDLIVLCHSAWWAL